MGPGTIPHPVRRTWTVEVRPHPDGPVLACPQCDEIPVSRRATAAWAEVVAHLALHARDERLAPHLRTCQCGEHGCRWHARHRGCDGPVLLLLARNRTGRTWRLADVCHACAAVTEHAATVPEPDACDPTDVDTAARPGGPPRAIGWDEDAMEGELCWIDGTP